MARERVPPMAKTKVTFFDVNDHKWMTERNYGTNSYTIEERDSRFYVWVDSLSGRHLVGVLPSMALAKTEVEIQIQKGGKR